MCLAFRNRTAQAVALMQLALAAWVIGLTPARAACDLWPEITTMQAQIKALEATPDVPARQRIGQSLNTLAIGLSRETLEEQLGAVGMGRQIETFIRFRDTATKLSILAEQPRRVAMDYLMRQDAFHEQMARVEAIVLIACSLDDEFTTPSAQASREIGIKALDILGAGRTLRFHVSNWALLSSGLFLLIAAAGAVLYTRLSSRKQRQGRRFNCDIALQLRLPHGERLSANCVDLSLLGAKLQLPEPPVPGTKICLGFARVRRHAKVQWANDTFAGVVFAKPLTRSQMRKLLAGDMLHRPAKGDFEEPEPGPPLPPEPGMPPQQMGA